LATNQRSASARIMTVTDSYEAMTGDRPYRKVLDMDVVKAELENGKGTQFDLEIVSTIIKVMKEHEFNTKTTD
jgi:HD-GYP domain-containing protein (c-di-GMP phosphodiesterase class II)